MDLVLVRHADAVEASPETADTERYLSDEGRAFFRKTAGTIARTGIGTPTILASPLRRAVETADILAEALMMESVTVREELAPGFSLPLLKLLVKEFQASPVLVLVGHEPDMTQVLAKLVSLPSTFSFNKGTAVKLRSTAPPGEGFSFEWLAKGNRLIRSDKEALGITVSQVTKERQTMSSVKELQVLQGIGEALSVKLAAAGYDTVAKVATAGEEGLRKVPGLNPRLIASILSQATALSESAGSNRDQRVAELKEKAEALKGQLQDLAREVRDRFQEKISGSTGRKVEKELLRLLSSLENAESVLEERVKKGGKSLMKAEKRLTGVAEGGLKDIRKGLKKARKSVEKVFAP